LKHGLLTRGSMIPIISFEQGLREMVEDDKILLLAWNFEEEIISDLRQQHYNGEFIEM
ncbi:MAG TPA: methyltransferase, partial [Candidatus Melainabacteria bacterium]|nr:methyltransferase [Candidatus Melainabacteria bacterium]